jgi:uncharacterized protein (TIGR03067 family)
MRRALFVAMLVGLVAGADGKKDDAKADQERLKGTWTIVSIERDGKANENAVGGKVTFDGDTMTFKVKDNEHKGTFKLDPTKKPRQIDLTPGDGPEKDKVVEGIYSLKKDELKICIAHPGNERPKDFESKEGSGHSLVTLKRGE